MSLGGGALALGGCRGLRCLGGACELGGGLVGPSGWAGMRWAVGWPGGGLVGGGGLGVWDSMRWVGNRMFGWGVAGTQIRLAGVTTTWVGWELDEAGGDMATQRRSWSYTCL